MPSGELGLQGSEGGSLQAAGGGEEAAALAAMDLQATMDTFLSRFVTRNL